jgi:hypothetical protein
VLGTIGGSLLMLAAARVGFELRATRPESVSLEAPETVEAGTSFGVFAEVRARRGSPAWRIRLEGRAAGVEVALDEREAILPPGASSVAVRIPLRVDPDGTLRGARGALGPARQWDLRVVVDVPGFLDTTSEPRIVRLSRP